MILPLALVALLAAPSDARELAIGEHLVDAAHPDRVACTPDGAVWLSAGGRTLCRRSGAASFDFVTGAFPASPRPTAAVEAPVRDRLIFSEGLRSPHIHGARTWNGGELVWYGRAATGITRVQGRALTHRALDQLVTDLDVDPAGALWAVGARGLMTGPAAGDAPLAPVPLPAFAPGNALDGALIHEDKLHVYGPAGLYRRDPVDTTGATTWTALTPRPVRDARAVPGGLGALTREHLLMFPGPNAVTGLPDGGAWRFAWQPAHCVFMATPGALHAAGVGVARPDPVVMVPGAPQVLAAAGSELALGLAGSPGGLWVGTDAGNATAPRLTGTWLPVSARALVRDGARWLAGTDEGLAAVENARVTWLWRRPGVTVDAIATLGTAHLVATSAGLYLLEGSRELAHLSLDGARATGLAVQGVDVWIATAAHGLMRVTTGVSR